MSVSNNLADLRATQLAQTLAVPTTITPPAAWVAFMDQAYSGGNYNYAISLTGPITHIDNTLLTGYLTTGAALAAGATTLDFSAGGALNLTDVNAIIQALATIGTSADSLDISGGTHAAPTLSAGRVNGTWVITITGTPVGTIQLVDFASQDTGVITFGTDIDTSSSNAITIATNLKTFLDAFGFTGWVITRVNSVVTVTISTDADLPLTAGTDSATNLTIADTAGTPSYIGQIERRGGSVTHN